MQGLARATQGVQVQQQRQQQAAAASKVGAVLVAATIDLQFSAEYFKRGEEVQQKVVIFQNQMSALWGGGGMPRGSKDECIRTQVGRAGSSVLAFKARFRGGAGKQGIRSMEFKGDSGDVHNCSESKNCSR